MQVYRLILFTERPGMGYPEGGSYDTGGTYEGCSLDNTGACQPVQFNHLQDAIDYAQNHGEVPVQVKSVDEVWSIISGQTAITDDMIIKSGGFLAGMDTTTLLLIAGGAILVLPMLFKKHGGAHAS